MYNQVRKFAFCGLAVAMASAVHARTLSVDEAYGLEAGWEMSSNDPYVGTRSGCFEGLTTVDYDGQVKPSLATSWKQIAPDQWDFTIRDGVKFQDGTPLNAETTANALNQLLSAVIPARAFSKKYIKSVDAVEPMTLRITTLTPTLMLPGQVASPSTSILSPAAYANGKIDPVGRCTGPFEIKRVDAKQGMTVKRNENYWGSKAKLEGAEIRFILDANTRTAQIRSGEADLVRTVSETMLGQLKKMPNIAVEEVKAPRTLMMILNNKRKPLDDVRVRQAIQAAIDTSAIVAAVYEGAATPAMGLFRTEDPWAPAGQKPAYDVAKAKRLLAEAGVAPGSLTLNLWGYTLKSELKDVGAVIQEMLAQVGIKVVFRMAEYKAIEPDMLSGNFDMAFMSRGYLTDVPEPIGVLSADYTCSGSYNMSHYCVAETDKSIAQISSLTEAKERYKAYASIAKKLNDDAVSIYLTHESLFDAVNKAVKSFRPHFLSYRVLTTDIE
jgi:peptide/nickel transport system substrate-binding protein